MFNKLSTLLLLVPTISALQLNQPTTQVHSQDPITVTWTTTAGDPATFDLYLTNDNFHNTFALKNTITTSDGTITVVIPVVEAGPGYTFQASPVGDVTSTLSQTGAFDIADPVSSSLSSSSSRPSSSGTGSSLSGGPPSLTTSSLGTTISRTSTPSSGSGTSNSSPSTTATGSFNGGNNTGGALSVTGIGATIVGVLVAAGAFLGL